MSNIGKLKSSPTQTYGRNGQGAEGPSVWGQSPWGRHPKRLIGGRYTAEGPILQFLCLNHFTIFEFNFSFNVGFRYISPQMLASNFNLPMFNFSHYCEIGFKLQRFNFIFWLKCSILEHLNLALLRPRVGTAQALRGPVPEGRAHEGGIPTGW